MLEVIVEAISLTGFPQTCQKHFSGGFRAATYEVTISVDGKDFLTCSFPEKESKQGKGIDGNLNRKFGCKISKETTVTIKVVCKHETMHDPHEISTAKFKDIGNVKFDEVTMKYKTKKKQMSGTLTLKVTRISATAELVQFKIPNKPTRCLYTVADLEGLGVVSQVLKSKLGLECPEWVNFLGSMGTLLKVAEPVAEVDPHAKLALSAAQIAFELFMKQKERDERVLGLVQVMANVYQMILDSDPLTKCRTLSQSVNELVALTRECAYFIAQYIKSGSFGQRMMLNAFSNADDLITQFEKQFFLIKEVFFAGIMLSIGQVTVRILEKLERMDETLNEIFDKMSFPVIGRSWSSFEACPDGTQETILSEIFAWGSDCNDTTPNIFLLLGTSSAAKTAISCSAAHYFHDIGRLGATIFFDAETSSCRNLVPSIFRELAIYDFTFRQMAMAGLKEYPKFLNDHPRAQFSFLDRQVFKSLTIIGPVVVIIDSLDMCKDSETWGLLDILSRFPPQFRLLITSMPGDSIQSPVLGKHCVVRKMTMIEDDDRWGSLELFISKCLACLESTHPHLFVVYSSQQISKEIYVKTNKTFHLAKLILEFIAIAQDMIAVKLLDYIVASEFPDSSIDAEECIENCFTQTLEVSGISADSIIRGKWKRLSDNYLPQLAENQYIRVIDGEISSGNYTTAIEFRIIHKLFRRCSTKDCNASETLRLVSIIHEITKYSMLFKDCISSALHCILACKCSHPPEAMKEENKPLIEYLLRAHQADCIHSESPNEASDAEAVQDVSKAILRHHTLLKEYEVHGCDVPNVRDASGVVYLTPPLQHSGLSTSAEKITLCKIFLISYSYFEKVHKVQVEAAIYRAVTEKGKDSLAKMQIKLEETGYVIEPCNENTNEADVQVVKNPLNGKGSWFVKNIRMDSNYVALWFNCPIPPSRVSQYLSENDATDGQGFVNSLLPGDRIAILAKSYELSRVSTSLTLFTDPKEKCPPAN